MNTFKAGDTIICTNIMYPNNYLVVGREYVVESTSTNDIQMFGCSYDAKQFKLVPERDIKRKALSDAVALLRDVGVSYYSQDHSVGVKRLGIVDEMPIAQMLDELYPDNTKACVDLQGIIAKLEASLSEAQNELFDLKGE